MGHSDTHAEIYQGGCHCGALRYAVTGHPQFAFVCHCDNCRRLNGGARMAGAAFAPKQLDAVGEPKTYTYRGGEGDIELNFCGHCGTPVYAFPKANAVVVIRLNSLDDQNIIPPAKAIYGNQACVWDRLLG